MEGNVELETDEHKEIFKKVHEKTDNSFWIASLPPKVRDEFKQFAHDEYMGHYGFAFKAVWDVFKGGMDVLNTSVTEELDKVNERLNKVEEHINKGKEVKEEFKVMADGTKLKKEA